MKKRTPDSYISVMDNHVPYMTHYFYPWNLIGWILHFRVTREFLGGRMWKSCLWQQWHRELIKASPWVRMTRHTCRSGSVLLGSRSGSRQRKSARWTGRPREEGWASGSRGSSEVTCWCVHWQRLYSTHRWAWQFIHPCSCWKVFIFFLSYHSAFMRWPDESWNQNNPKLFRFGLKIRTTHSHYILLYPCLVMKKKSQ